MKIYTIDYKAHRDKNGCVYRQTVKIDRDLQQKFNNKVNREKRKVKKSIDENHTFNNYEMDILYFTHTLKKGVNFSKRTTLRKFGEFIIKKGLYNDMRIQKRLFFNRNTIIEVL